MEQLQHQGAEIFGIFVRQKPGACLKMTPKMIVKSLLKIPVGLELENGLLICILKFGLHSIYQRYI